MDRRCFLQALGTVSLAALTGCASRAPDSGAASPTGTGGAAPNSDALARVVPSAAPSLAVLTAQAELLVGADQRVAFGLATQDNTPVENADVRVWLVPEAGSPTGPSPASFHPRLGARGVYLASVDVAAPGGGWGVAVTGGEAEGGQAATRALAPSDSATVTSGEPAVAAATPTMADPLGVGEVCTRRPPCGMHETSLDGALADGRPVVLTFATPAYCQTAMCGPVVDTVESARAARDWGDVAWIHVEIYADAGRTLMPAVADWGLPSEPWVFFIDRRGTVTARLEGPVLEPEVATLAAALV
ncbi:MAG TPA: hypothetical protein VG452_12275 [Egibacteraceae bacterium]|nr:hypothetical protein [Egibacteraceae bacterium]